MIANYHTHTYRCGHAFGTERSYVENAIAGGLQILGFSDHTPQFFDGNYVSTIRMRTDELPDYVDTVSALRDEYKDQIAIHIGVEAEYYPSCFEKLHRFLCDYGVEYMILGQHCLSNEYDDIYCGAPTHRERDLDRYCKQSIEALETGLFAYFAHPDLIHFTGSEVTYDRHVARLCERVKELSVPLEINLLGLREHRHYPNSRFWKIAGEIGCDVIYGSDAHKPEHVYDPETILAADKLVQKNGLHLIDTVHL